MKPSPPPPPPTPLRRTSDIRDVRPYRSDVDGDNDTTDRDSARHSDRYDDSCDYQRDTFEEPPTLDVDRS